MSLMPSNFSVPEPIRTFRHGRLVWQFADGTTLPVVRGGDGEGDLMEPEEIDRLLEAPEGQEPDLSNLSADELDRLRRSIEHHYQQTRGDDGHVPTAEEREILRSLAADAERVDAEVGRREQENEAALAEVRELDERMARRNAEEQEEEEGEPEGGAPPGEVPAEQLPEQPVPNDQTEGQPERIAASAAPRRRRSFTSLTRNQPARSREPDTSPFGRAVITASADVPELGGRRITTEEEFARSFMNRWPAVQGAYPQAGGDLRFPVLRVEPNVDPRFHVPDGASARQVSQIMGAAADHFMSQVRSNVAALRSDDRRVLLASGGPCVPNERTFDVPFVASDATPFTDGFPVTRYARNGVDFFPPLCFVRRPSRTQASVTTANGSPTLTGAAAGAFTQDDVGRTVTGTGVPAGTTITAVAANGSTATMSANATASGTVTVTLVGRSGNIARVITPTQDAAGYVSQGGTTPDKACVRIDCPSQISCNLNMLLLCLTIGNWINETFPEYVATWRQSVAVAFAQGWEEYHIGQVLAGSTLMSTGAATFGATRDVLSRTVRMVEHVRSARRLGDNVPFRAWFPSWFVPALKNDLLASIGGADDGYSNFNVSDAQLIGWFAARGINVSTYIDEAGDPGATPNTSTVLPLPTTGAVPAFPTTVRTFLYREGTWVRGQGASLELGLIRDSQTLKVNDFQTFQETASKMCYRGCPGESYVVDHTVLYDGLSAGAINPRA